MGEKAFVIGRMYKENDPDMPEEFRQFMIKLLKYVHIENSGNPYCREVVANIAAAGLRFAPDGKTALTEAVIVKQEAEHGEIVAKLIRSFGEDPEIEKEVGQYAFKIPLESWCDVAWFHMLIDRVGLYVGIEWMSSTYEPLAKVSPRLEREEHFHAMTGFKHLQKIVKTEAGRKEAQELLYKWWPAALDMFGRSELAKFRGLCQMGHQGQDQQGAARAVHRRDRAAHRAARLRGAGSSGEPEISLTQHRPLTPHAARGSLPLPQGGRGGRLFPSPFGRGWRAQRPG